MTAPPPSSHFDDAIRRYLAGESFGEIQAATGVTSTGFHRERARRDIPPRRHLTLPSVDIAAEYTAGESEYALSLKYSVGRGTIRSRLLEQGVQIRDQSEAGLVRTSRMTFEERGAQAWAANNATRGVTPDEDRLERAARTRMERGGFDSAAEKLLWELCSALGLHLQSQMAIGRYNVDLANRPVAVEVFGGGWHLRRKARHAERTKQILDQGWHLLIVWDLSESRLGAGAAEYLHAWHQEASGQPASTREYRVISGEGQLLSAGRVDRYEFTLEPPPRSRLHPWA